MQPSAPLTGLGTFRYLRLCWGRLKGWPHNGHEFGSETANSKRVSAQRFTIVKENARGACPDQPHTVDRVGLPTSPVQKPSLRYIGCSKQEDFGEGGVVVDELLVLGGLVKLLT